MFSIILLSPNIKKTLHYNSSKPYHIILYRILQIFQIIVVSHAQNSILCLNKESDTSCKNSNT